MLVAALDCRVYLVNSLALTAKIVKVLTPISDPGVFEQSAHIPEKIRRLTRDEEWLYPVSRCLSALKECTIGR